MVSDVTLPTALEAEQQVLGSLILEPVRISEVSKVLQPGDFEGGVTMMVLRREVLRVRNAMIAANTTTVAGGPTR